MGGDGPLRGLPGGNVSVIDIRLAIGLCVADCAGGVDVSPIETGGIGSGMDVGKTKKFGISFSIFVCLSTVCLFFFLAMGEYVIIADNGGRAT